MRSARRSCELALYDFCAGTDTRAYEWLGGHRLPSGEYRFRLYAPRVRGVTLFADFLREGRCRMAETAVGVWSVTVRPEISPEGMRYAYMPMGMGELLADPFARRTAADASSLVCTEGGFDWQDEVWMRARRNQLRGPICFYGVHLSSFATRQGQSCGTAGAYLNYRELGGFLAGYVTRMGCTHVRLMPLCEHVREQSHGYEADSLFAPTSRHGTPDDLRAMIDHLHRAGIGVVMDLPLCRCVRPLLGLTSDGMLDAADPAVQSLLLSVTLFWLREFHLDGISPIGAEDWPRDFRERYCATVHSTVPGGMLIGGEQTVCGEMSWDLIAHERFGEDTIGAIGMDALRWQSRQDRLTLTVRQATEFGHTALLELSATVSGRLREILMRQIGGGYLQGFAAARLAQAYLMAHPGKKQMFMGSELGQSRAWDGTVPPDWFLRELPTHAAYCRYVQQLNHFYRHEPRLWMREEATLTEIVPTVVMLRRSDETERELLVLLNFGDAAQTAVLQVTRGIRVLFDSDRVEFGGEGRIEEIVQAKAGRVEILLPPLSAVFCEEWSGYHTNARSFVLPPQ